MSQNYRLLNDGETIQDGDDFFHYDKKEWMPSDYQGITIGEGFCIYRRPLPPELYEFVKRGEPLKAGDEYSYNQKWNQFNSDVVGEELNLNEPVRRLFNPSVQPASPEPAAQVDSVDPGEGYRLLEEGEIIEQGDQYFGTDLWKDHKGCVGETYTRNRAKVMTHLLTRRKIPVTPSLPPPNWRTFDVKPEDDSKEVMVLNTKFGNMEKLSGWRVPVNEHFTHWTTNEEWMASLPKSAPVVDEEREAFEKWGRSQRINLSKRPDGMYADCTSNSAWLAWKARAALTTK